MSGVDEGTTHNVCGVNGCLQCHCHDCVVYWQEKAEQLQAELEETKASMLFWRGLKAKETDAALAAERNSSLLREAMKRYGAHHRECPLVDSIARLRGLVPCICGLADLLERNP